ncbi:MAG: protein kinase [Pirellulales bacterium]
MSQLTVSTFLDVVERSGLVDRGRLESVISDLERDSGPEAVDSRVVSSRLTEAGLLTPWQSERLLQGRHKGFFVGKYKLLDHLGTGGMSSVFLAEHVLMRRRVAVKVLPQNRVHDTSYLARFHREARAVAALDHPNIVRAFDVDNEEDVHYLVMEYVDGRDLKQMVESDGPLDFATAAETIRQAAEGLAHAHEAGLIHRDMKPANLLIDSKGTVKVLDLGLARFADEVEASLTNEHDEKMLGTVDYLAPEQAVNSHMVDARADIYSLGCTLYFALTGLPPFPTGSLAQRVFMHQTQEPPSIYQKRPDAPAELVAIFRRMTAKSPDARYQSAAEVSRALEHWIQMYRDRLSRQRTGKARKEEELTLAPLDEEVKRTAQPAATPITSTPAPAAPARRKSPSDAPGQAKRLAKPGSTPSTGTSTAQPASDSTAPASGPKQVGPVETPLPPTGSRLDDLLSDLPPASPTSSGASPLVGPSGSGRMRASGANKTKPKNLWDSPWFVMGVGALLAVVMIVVWILYSALLG